MRRLSGYGPSLIVLATAALVLFAGPKAVQRLTYEQTKTRIIQARHSLANNDILEQLNSAYADIATIVEPSVVHISARYTEKLPFREARDALSTGSGWIFDDDGHIVTNHHVVQGATRIDVQLYNGLTREAEIIGSDPSTDIAVIKVSSGELHPATIAELSQPISQGDLVFAFGSPFDFRFSMSAGVVSGKDRSVGVIRGESGRSLGYENFIQVDAAINPGNSGGPLTDFRGRVIGMNTAIATGRSRNGTFEEGQFAGIGLAIPMDMILPVVTQLIESGYVEKGFMGVEPRELSAIVAQQLGHSGQGVFISGVEEGGPASQAGVRANDIVTHIGGKSVATVAQLRSMVSSMRPGQKVRLSVWRYDTKKGAGERIELDVGLTKLDMVRATGTLPPDQDRTAIPVIGIARMATSTPQLAREHGATHQPGVMILETVPGSDLARRARPGAIITHVMEQPIHDVESFIERLNDYDLRRPFGLEATVHQPDGERLPIYLRIQ